MSDSNARSRKRFRSVRKKLLSVTPFIRRGRHERVMARLERHLERMQEHVNEQRKLTEELGSLFLKPPTNASSATSLVRVPFERVAVAEVCFFVTHAPNELLKPHVVDHIGAMLDADIHVFLIVNADVSLDSMQIPASLEERLSGCLIRENVGFDFAAWAHAYALCDLSQSCKRLYLVNDSIVGPLNEAAYQSLLQRIRECDADFIGLTMNPDPHPHLQSFFLVFNERVLSSDTFRSFLTKVVNLPLKQNVIDCYEIWLTPYLNRSGFRGEAIFPNLSKLPAPCRNDTHYAWRELIQAGFPFIKSLVLRDPVHAKSARALLPSRYQ